jgi:L-arabinokinase
MDCPTGSAPGRLDFLGGVADYSGALVLEMPTHQSIDVVAEPDDAFVVGPAVLSVTEMVHLAELEYVDVRRALEGLPRWTLYLVGVAVVLVRHGIISPPRARLRISSDLPASMGVASSAALEVATARALGAGSIDPLQLALLCQEAENFVVGAPCGVMDQVAVAVGSSGALLPILCRPASPWPTVTLPADLEIVGWPSGAAHDVSGAPYRRARAAAFMGKRMVEASEKRSWSWVSELPAGAATRLPEEISGAEFLERWAETGDVITAVQPEVRYPVRASVLFGIEEHLRSGRALAALRRGEPEQLGPLLSASHAGYEGMGLGHPAVTATVETALATPGVLGARASGGGCGGTVVVICARGALAHVDGLIR